MNAQIILIFTGILVLSVFLAFRSMADFAMPTSHTKIVRKQKRKAMFGVIEVKKKPQ